MLLQKIAILFIVGSVFSFCKKEKEQFTYQLASTPVRLERTSFEGSANISIVHVHDNEATAHNAAQTVLKKHGGSLLTLINNRHRLLKFTQGNTMYAVDPNRIFTPAGRKGTLQKWSRFEPAIAKTVAQFSDYFISLIPADKPVVAVHNNTDNAYSIGSYSIGGELVNDAKAFHINPLQDRDDFFITTSAALFEKLKTENYNVVLQHNKRATDDGSLSIYYAEQEQMYVNVEAEHGHLDEQIKMLELLTQILP